MFVTAVEARPEMISGEIFNVGDYHLNLRSASSSNCTSSEESGVYSHPENDNKGEQDRYEEQ
jgi:hypothetical protein